MAKFTGTGHGSAGTNVHNAGVTSQATLAPPLSDGDGHVSGSNESATKQPGSWAEYAVRLVDCMNESDLIPARVLTSLEGAPKFFTCRGYGIHVIPSDELLTVVFSNGTKHEIN